MQLITNISNLYAAEYIMDNSHTHLAAPRLSSSFGLILEGEVVFSYGNRTFKAVKNDIVFIPNYIVYKSNWTGNPKIRFLSLNFDLPQYVNFFDMQNFKAQTTHKELFFNIIKLVKDNVIASVLEAYSLFYKFFAEIIIYLSTSSTPVVDMLVQEAIKFMKANLDTHLSVETISKHCAVSQSTLYQAFKKCLNFTPITVLNSLKIEKVCELLSQTTLPLKEIIQIVYFNSENYLQKCFKKITGINTSSYRKKFRKKN